MFGATAFPLLARFAGSCVLPGIGFPDVSRRRVTGALQRLGSSPCAASDSHREDRRESLLVGDRRDVG